MSTSTSSEPRNPLYLALLLIGLVFVMTALAYAVIPVLEEKARQRGEPAPPSAFRDELRANGWKWLLWEVGVMIAVGVASMAIDRRRSLQKSQSATTIPVEKPPDTPPEPSSHGQEQIDAK